MTIAKVCVAAVVIAVSGLASGSGVAAADPSAEPSGTAAPPAPAASPAPPATSKPANAGSAERSRGAARRAPGNAPATGRPSDSRRSAPAGSPPDPPATTPTVPGQAVPAGSESEGVRGDQPSPTSTVATPYGNLGQWMINSDNEIADWIGLPYQGRTVMEGINVVIVDSASGNPTQAASNLNAWMTRAGFAPSAVSSTGYQGVIESNIFGQQPTGPHTAFRDNYFLLANSHGRIFGPYPNPNGPGFIWTASLSEENLDLENLTHGYESFNAARNELRDSMVSAGGQDLGQIFMDNVYNTVEYTTGDADGFAAVIGLPQVLKTATAPRGGNVGTPKR